MKQFVIMKTLFLSLVLGTAFLLSSCSEDEEVPDAGTFSVDFTFHVFDNYGNNLLDPLNENNILSQDITATFKGKTGRLNEFVSFYSFYYYVHNKTITFGTLSEEDCLSKEKLVIKWGNGTESVLQNGLLDGEEWIVEFPEDLSLKFPRIVLKEQEHATITYKPMQIVFTSGRSFTGAVLNYKGVEYKYQELRQDGFYLERNKNIIGGVRHRFKDILADEVLINEPMTITWADGRKDELILNNYKNEQGRLIRNITHNGVFLGNVFEIRI